MSAPVAAEPFSSVVNGSAGNSAPVSGGRRRGSKKLKLVTRKQARKMLKKMGRRMRGGQEKDAVAVPEEMTEGGRRHRGRKTRRHSKRSLFGLKY